ncbi:UNVERIFIED_CONTAM: hypothetical protein PYX00_004965 [Menopon gallinae]|uniref:non-specific serine/threonine protein kinase n=1 Tax=Menopon gallinae TaxID=328185 RepID=A0AAW2I7K3_9NEOP
MQVKNRVMPCPKICPQDKTDSGSNADRKSETPYEKLMQSLHNDPKWLEEVSLDRRVGLYKFRGELGSGNFSQVKLAVHQLTNERVAIKIVDKGKLDEKTMRMLNQEISTMETVYHPNLIRLYEVVETYSKLYLVMEFASGGELYNKVVTTGKLDELVARQLFAQICSAVDHMHSKSIIHRDIKAENVFFSGPNKVKIGDFGLSAQLTEGPNQLLSTICGSPPYAAPELFCEETYIGGPVDVWALGILLYFMVVGRRPFRGQNVPSLKKSILSGLYKLPSHLSRECADLIDGILKQKPSERLTISQILSSDWLKGIQLPSAPEASQSFTLAPTILKYSPDGTELQLPDIEQTARQRLSELGISSQLLASQSCQGSRSHVIGCYRIIVHRIQKQLGVFLDRDGHLTSEHQWPRQQEKIPDKKFVVANFCQTKQGSEDFFSNCWRRKPSSDDECEAKGKKDSKDKDRLSLGEGECLQKEARVSLFRQLQTHSAAVKGGPENTVPVLRSSTCVIL